MIAALWSKIQLLMDNSYFFRFIERIMKFISRLFSGSVIVRSLSKDMDDDSLKSSLSYKVVMCFFNLLNKMRDSFFLRMWENSAVVAFMRKLPVKLLSLTLRAVGIGVLSFAAIYTVLIRKFNYLSMAAFIIGLICLFFKERLYNLIRDGIIMRFISYLFDFTLPDIEYVPSNPVYPVIYGVYGSLVFYFLSFEYALAALAAIPCALLVVAYPFIGVLAAVFLVPFIPTMLMAALIGGVFVLFILKLLTDKSYTVKLDLTGIFVALFILITIFKGFTSLAPKSSINIALLTSLFMMSFFLAVSMTDTMKKFELLIFAFSTSALFTGLYGLYQKYSGKVDMTWVDKEIFDGIRLRVFSTFANPNVFGEYLLLAIPVALIAIIYAKRPLLKLYYAGVSAILIVNLALTLSRGCYLAIVIAVFIFVLIMEKRLIALLSAGIFILPIILPPSILERFQSITNLNDSSTSYRIFIYQATLRILQKFWPLGLGQGMEAFNIVYPLYGFNGVTAPHSHNLFLQVFVETGIFGFIAFIAMFFCFYKTLFPFFYKTKTVKNKWMAAGLIAMMSGFIIQSFFDYSFYNYKVYMLFFIILAFARICANCGSEETS